MATGLAGGVAVHGYYRLIEIPHELALQREELTSQFERQALETKHEVELARFKYIEQLTNQFYQQQTEDEAWHQAQLDQLNQEIADYEKADSGRYGLDQPALDFLSRVRAQPPAAPH
jgi:hypothetical protein